MPLIVEDGSNVADANSYITRAELIAYAADRGVTIADDAASDVFAVKAFDHIESQPCFKGTQTYDDQMTAFPRKIYDGDGVLLYAEDTIPVGVKKAQLGYAVAVSQGVDLAPTITADADVKREKVGPLETEYFERSRADARVPQADAALEPFLCGQSFGLTVVRV